MAPSVKLSELLDALEYVSGSGQFENSAYLERTTGKVYFDSEDLEMEEQLPEDYEDGRKYIAIPHKIDLNLGSNLAIKFIEDFLPERFDQVANFFLKRGAYSRFKDLLERRDMLEHWHKYEAEAVEAAMRTWAKENRLQIEPAKSRTGV